jgi:hypothetical protein
VSIETELNPVFTIVSGSAEVIEMGDERVFGDVNVCFFGNHQNCKKVFDFHILQFSSNTPSLGWKIFDSVSLFLSS